MGIDGSNVRKLTQETYAGFNSVTWNHSGTQLAFTGSQGSNLDLWIVGLDGAPERAVTTNHGGASGASWSPDGSRLAYLIAANDQGTVAVSSSLAATEATRIHWRVSSAGWTRNGPRMGRDCQRSVILTVGSTSSIRPA